MKKTKEKHSIILERSICHPLEEWLQLDLRTRKKNRQKYMKFQENETSLICIIKCWVKEAQKKRNQEEKPLDEQ